MYVSLLLVFKHSVIYISIDFRLCGWCFFAQGKTGQSYKFAQVVDEMLVSRRCAARAFGTFSSLMFSRTFP